jgi:hypothetical protein
MPTHLVSTDLTSSAPVMFSSFGLSTIIAGGSRFGGLVGGVISVTEGMTEIVMPRVGTIKNLTIYLETAQPASGSLVFMVRKNRADTALTKTIAANAAAGMYTDPTHSFAVAQGDRLALQITNNALLVSAQILGASVTYEK